MRERGPEVNPSRQKNAREGAFTRHDRMSTEVEVSQFIGDAVRLIKPRLVVETGTHKGFTALEIDRALAENEQMGFPGRLITFETDPELAVGCSEQLSDRVEVVNDACWNHQFTERIDIAFVDSAYAARIMDIEALSNYMAPRGLMFLHDTAMIHMEEMRRVVNFVRGKFNVVEFATARGLGLLQPRGNLWSKTGSL
jgi:predicted O-methyltransferase YrrM